MANTKIPSELSSTPSISDSGDSTAITIDSSERVGVGVSSMTHKLEIDGTVKIDDNDSLRISNYNTFGQTVSGAMGIIGHNAVVDNSTANKVTALNASWYPSFIKMYYDHGITFHVSNSLPSAGDTLLDGLGTNSLERMRITGDGNVGINNRSPQFDLDTNEARLGYYSAKGLGYNFFTTSISFSSGTSTKYIAISYGTGLFYNLDLDLHGQYGNFNAEGGIRKVYTGGVNASDSNIYGNGNAQIFSLGNTATYYSTGTAAKSGTAKIRIPITGTSLPASDTLHVGIRMFGIHLDRITSIAIE